MKPDAGKKRKRDEWGSMQKISNNENSREDVKNWRDWISATATKNYIMEDGFLDLLKVKSFIFKQKTYHKEIFNNTSNSNSFISALLSQGIRFEKAVIKLLKRKIGNNDFIDICGNVNPHSYDKYLKTIEEMENGTPVIYQGIVRNYFNRTYGVPDLIVRSDWIHKFINFTPLSKKESLEPALGLKTNKCERKYHYIVIDIKFKTLQLNSDGIHLRNDGILKAYKSQLYIYNKALGLMQSYTPNAAFILGWKWKYVSKKINYSGNNCFDKLGKIDYTGNDKMYVEKTNNALKWLRELNKEGNTWDLTRTPLPRKEMYPNMCNKYDYPYHKIKKKFAEDIQDITLIWKCGPKQRKIAHDKGIYTWNDHRLNPQNMGMKIEKYTSKVISRILDANKSQNLNIHPNYIKTNTHDWKNDKKLEFFIDFEMTCGVLTDFDDLPVSKGESYIFLIGIGYIHPINNKWIFEDFVVQDISEKEENRICLELLKYIKFIENKFKTENSPLYHWSKAEPSAWKRAQKRCVLNWKFLNWVDLLDVFQKEPIGVKGCLNYGLKTIAKTFHQYGYIKTIWDKNTHCIDGANTALGAYQISLRCKENNTNFSEEPLMKEIISYNEIDCKVLQEILKYLRNNHIAYSDKDVIKKKRRKKEFQWIIETRAMKKRKHFHWTIETRSMKIKKR